MTSSVPADTGEAAESYISKPKVLNPQPKPSKAPNPNKESPWVYIAKVVKVRV